MLLFIVAAALCLPGAAVAGAGTEPGDGPPRAAGGRGRSVPRPDMELRAQAGIAAYRSAACGCIDRYPWGASAGAAARWHRSFAVEADYRFGGIWFPRQGYLDVQGFGLGVRGLVLPEGERWWSGLYARAGYQQLRIQATRRGVFHGGYGAIGIEHGLPYVPAWIRMEHELPVTFVAGGLSHLTIGLRGGLVMRF